MRIGARLCVASNDNNPSIVGMTLNCHLGIGQCRLALSIPENSAELRVPQQHRPHGKTAEFLSHFPKMTIEG